VIGCGDDDEFSKGQALILYAALWSTGAQAKCTALVLFL
jgi:hypothetical protein